eukprot:42252_1
MYAILILFILCLIQHPVSNKSFPCTFDKPNAFTLSEANVIGTITRRKYLDITFEIKLLSDCVDEWCTIFRIGPAAVSTTRDPYLGINGFGNVFGFRHWNVDANQYPRASLAGASININNSLSELKVDGIYHSIYIEINNYKRSFSMDNVRYWLNEATTLGDSQQMYSELSILFADNNIDPALNASIKNICIRSEDFPIWPYCVVSGNIDFSDINNIDDSQREQYGSTVEDCANWCYTILDCLGYSFNNNATDPTAWPYCYPKFSFDYNIVQPRIDGTVSGIKTCNTIMTTSPSQSPTPAPSIMTFSPTKSPSKSPTTAPSMMTKLPSKSPSTMTQLPSISPTIAPTSCDDDIDNSMNSNTTVNYAQMFRKFQTENSTIYYVNTDYIECDIMNNNNVCSVQCTQYESCKHGVIGIEKKNLSTLTVGCTGKLSCNNVVIDITDSTINTVFIYCTDNLSCNEMTLRIRTSGSTQILIYCDY